MLQTPCLLVENFWVVFHTVPQRISSGTDSTCLSPYSLIFASRNRLLNKLCAPEQVFVSGSFFRASPQVISRSVDTCPVHQLKFLQLKNVKESNITRILINGNVLAHWPGRCKDRTDFRRWLWCRDFKQNIKIHITVFWFSSTVFHILALFVLK